jgi:DNA invertase Pin-like site-specific DNA recombinase
LEVLTESLWNNWATLEALFERSQRRGSKRKVPAPRVYQRQHHLTRDERAEVVRRYLAGETIATLAAAFGCHRDAIRRALSRQNVELRNWRTKVADPTRVVDLYEAGQTAAQIAAEFGVSATAVLNHLRGAGVVFRARGKVPR